MEVTVGPLMPGLLWGMPLSNNDDIYRHKALHTGIQSSSIKISLAWMLHTTDVSIYNKFIYCFVFIYTILI